MAHKKLNSWEWLEGQIDFIRGELRAIKALLGRNYGSSTEEEGKEETDTGPNEEEA